MDQKALVRAEWGIKTLEQQLEELTARLGPRRDWFELRCYVWNFEEFKKLLEKYGVPQTAKNLEVHGVKVHEDKTLVPGTVEVRLVPKIGQPYGSMIG